MPTSRREKIYNGKLLFIRVLISVVRLPPGGRDALRKYACGIFLAKAGSKLCLRPGSKAAAANICVGMRMRRAAEGEGVNIGLNLFS